MDIIKITSQKAAAGPDESGPLQYRVLQALHGFEYHAWTTHPNGCTRPRQPEVVEADKSASQPPGGDWATIKVF